MKTIYKYVLELKDTQVVDMHEGAVILTVQVQHTRGYPFNRICLWAEVDTDKPVFMRTIKIYGTGNPANTENEVYVGTVQFDDFVWHVYRDRP